MAAEEQVASSNLTQLKAFLLKSGSNWTAPIVIILQPALQGADWIISPGSSWIILHVWANQTANTKVHKVQFEG